MRFFYSFYSGVSSEHAFFITTKEKVFGFGKNSDGQLGFGYTNADREKVKEVEFFRAKKVNSIACGLDHSLFLLSNGVVLSAGSKYCGQVSAFKKDSDVGQSTPVRVLYINPVSHEKEKLSGVKAIFCGRLTSFFLTSQGLYASGSNNKFELGVGKLPGDAECVYIAQRVKIKERVSKVYAGYHHTVFWTKRKQVYVTGLNSHGQCSVDGIGTSDDRVKIPVRVTFFDNLPDRVISVFCSSCCTFFVTEKGLYGAGRNESGEMGTGNQDSMNGIHKLDFYDDKLPLYKLYGGEYGGGGGGWMAVFAAGKNKQKSLYHSGFNTGQFGITNRRDFSAPAENQYFASLQATNIIKHVDVKFARYFIFYLHMQPNGNTGIYGGGSYEYRVFHTFQAQDRVRKVNEGLDPKFAVQLLNDEFKIRKERIGGGAVKDYRERLLFLIEKHTNKCFWYHVLIH